MPGRATIATFGALAAVLAAAFYWGLHRLARADARAVLASPSFAGTGRLSRDTGAGQLPPPESPTGTDVERVANTEEHGRLRRRARHGGRLAAAALACGLVACPLFAATCGYSMYYDVRVHEVRLPPASCSGSNRALTNRRPLHPHHYLMQPSSLQEVSACGLRGGGGGLTTKKAFFVAIVVHVYLHALARAVLPGLRGPTWARWARALAPGGIALVGVALAASFALEPDLAKARRLRV